MKPKSIKFVWMTIHEATRELIRRLGNIYDSSEATHIAELVMENISGKTRTNRIADAHINIAADTGLLLLKYIDELSTGKPVQYVLNEAWFAGMKLYVDENVLIPRPETEELVEWVVSEVKAAGRNDVSIADIGTGSGCIAIALKARLPRATVYAIDLSVKALEVASRNARQQNVSVAFEALDILDKGKWPALPSFNIIVSNPPYVPEREKPSLHPNVLNFEPHTALFVPDRSPLIFYQEIADFAESNSAQQVYFEIHQQHGSALEKYFAATTFRKMLLRKDINGHDRFLRLEK